MLGTFIIWITFVMAIVSAYAYYASVKKKNIIELARGSFYATVIGIFAAALLLWIYIIQHSFEYHYITRYSSRDLPFELLITSFWAGQEGSFLLWALIAAIVGLVLCWRIRRAKMESETMLVYSIILIFLSLLIAIKSPFKYIWDVAANNIPVGYVPQDGQGLNPLLQNFWMIIHPPVLFIGFASLAVPFVIAVAGLWQKKYKEWINTAFPWVLFGSVSLGAGLILGGYWAYGVLGWGGWWGWDPVENSSLIPWMLMLILIHTILIQKMRGKLVRLNFALAISAYLLVIYSTFLTRSGLLANASVHSFGSPGSLFNIMLLSWITVPNLLLIWLGVLALIGFGFMIARWKGMRTKRSQIKWLARETLLTIAAIVMGISAVLILFGTNRPLFSDSSFEPAFYDSVNIPLAALMTLLLGLSLYSKWNKEERDKYFRNLIGPAVFSVVVLVVLIFLKLDDFATGVLVFTSLFALYISIDRLYFIAKEQPLHMGSAVSHAGLALLFLGIIASGTYETKQSVSLPIYQTESVFGYDLTYAGAVPLSPKKDKHIIEVVSNGNLAILEPEAIKIPRTDAVLWSPDYMSTWKGDLYIEPVSIEANTDNEGQTVESLAVDVIIKPFMNLVWIGAGLIIAGLALAVVRRTKEKN